MRIDGAEDGKQFRVESQRSEYEQQCADLAAANDMLNNGATLMAALTRAHQRAKSVRLRRAEWEVRTVDLKVAQDLVRRLHYSGGGSNTATYRHGLFRKGRDECLGVAWWIPPTKTAANATWPADWKGVLALTRLAIEPDVPKNGASFLLGKSMARIDRRRWPCLVTYADEMQGHTGAIYRATNWEYCGMTAKEATFFKDGRMVARKAGPKTRTHAEMLAMGCEMVGRFAKHKFRHVATAAVVLRD